ncbi:hypothetical protein HMPREF1564_2071 [Providencia alcalifaciens R90-1475]|nr:hypothetical protein HMPREF1564_2071 [Providencia alcalifaciens R90-1475]
MISKISSARMKRRTLLELSRIRQKYNKAPDYIFEFLDVKSYDEKINEFINDGNSELNQASVDRIIKDLNISMITDDELPFITDDFEVISFYWGYIFNYFIYNKPFLNEDFFLDTNARIKCINTSTIRLKQKFLYNYFDLFDNEAPYGKEHKLNLISNARLKLNFESQNTKIPKWISHLNPIGVSWAEKYIKKNFSSVGAYSYYSLGNLINIYESSVKKNKCISILNILKLWDTHPAEKESFINKMNKAWLQERRREEMKDYTNLSCSIKIENKEKLLIISNHLDMKINKTVDFLIDNFHEDIKNEIKK